MYLPESKKKYRFFFPLLLYGYAFLILLSHGIFIFGQCITEKKKKENNHWDPIKLSCYKFSLKTFNYFVLANLKIWSGTTSYQTSKRIYLIPVALSIAQELGKSEPQSE